LSAFILVFTIYFIKGFKSSEFPLVNSKKAFELTRGRSKKEFIGGALEMILKRLKQAPGKPFRMIADFGDITILPPEYAYEIRNHDQLSFTQAAFRVSVDGAHRLGP
jgi:cytochrome P450 monooxygenase-1